MENECRKVTPLVTVLTMNIGLESLAVVKSNIKLLNAGANRWRCCNFFSLLSTNACLYNSATGECKELLAALEAILCTSTCRSKAAGEKWLKSETQRVAQ